MEHEDTGQLWARGRPQIWNFIVVSWAKLCLILCDPVDRGAWLATEAHQAPLSMGVSRQEHWSGLPFPFSRNLPHPGIKLEAPAL